MVAKAAAEEGRNTAQSLKSPSNEVQEVVVQQMSSKVAAEEGRTAFRLETNEATGGYVTQDEN